MTRDPPPELASLAALSAELGRDPEQVQAAGGNTSLKADGLLWVKASGTWLADALIRPIFVPIELTPMLAAIEADAADPVSAAVVPELNPEKLRPSIETTLHAVMPHPVVIHTHSVRTIALAIRTDAEELLTPRLAGLAWRLIPYLQPGLPLSRAIAAELAAGPADVFVLGNHGLVVGGADGDAAAALLAEVERRLEAPCRAVLAPMRHGLNELAEPLQLRPARHREAQALANDLLALPWITTGSLYPDHVIFLGPGVARLPAARAGAEAQLEALGAGKALGQKLFIQPGVGTFVAAEAPASADELALCLGLVMERVPAAARLRYLSADDEAALLDWDAEKYRQALAGARGQGS